jgi:hypothetical protein
MSVLLGLSAGRDSLLGKLALAAAPVSVMLALTIYRPVLGSGLILAGNVFVFAVAAAALATTRRSDTRHIALLLTATAALPLLLFFWSPAL